MRERAAAILMALTLAAVNSWGVSAADNMPVSREGETEQTETVAQETEKKAERADTDEINWDEYHTDPRIVYMDNPVLIKLSQNIYGDYSIAVQDESICKIEPVEGMDYVSVTALKEGTTKYLIISPHGGGMTCYMYGTITVKPLPEDAVKINDPALYQVLVDINDVDSNENGYIELKELQSIRSLNLSDRWDSAAPFVKDWSALRYIENLESLSLKSRGLTDLTILEYFQDLSGLETLNLSDNRIQDLTPVRRAVNLKTLYAYDNLELEDISILQELHSLKKVEISNTAVTEAGRMEAAGFTDRILMKPGEELAIPEIYGLLNDCELKIQQMTGQDVLSVEQDSYICQMKALKGGVSRIQVSYGDYTKSVVVVVERDEPSWEKIGAHQEAAEEIDLDQNFSGYKVETEDETICMCELDGNVLRLTGKKQGVTVVRLINPDDGTIEKVWEVTVEEWPEENIFTEYPMIWESTKTYTKEEAEDMKIRSVDDSVCSGEKMIISDSTELGKYHVGIRLKGTGAGRTVLLLENSSGEVFEGVQAVVSILPEDGVRIQDDCLREGLLASEDMNKNGDGYISEKEIQSCRKLVLNNAAVKDYSELGLAENLKTLTITGCGLTSIEELPELPELRTLLLSSNSLKDLTGIERYKNIEILDVSKNDIRDIDILGETSMDSLSELYLEGNSHLVSVKPLEKAGKLEKISLDGTGVTAEGRFALAGCYDREIGQGTQIRIPKVEGAFGTEFSVEIEGDSDVVSEEKKSEEQTVIQGMNDGNVNMKVSYGGVTHSYDIKVVVRDPDQPVGAEMIGVAWPDGDIVMAQGGAWRLYPKVEKVGENIQYYFSQWIECKDGRELCESYIDNNDTLWIDSEKVAENIWKVDCGYAYSDRDQTLTNIRNRGNEVIENVSDWEKSGMTLYILKTDGSLWYRKEVLSDKEAGKLELLDTDVKSLNGEDGYIKNDSSYWAYQGGFSGLYAAREDGIQPGRGFYGKDDYYYYIWIDQDTGERSYVQTEYFSYPSGFYESTERVIDGERCVFARIDRTGRSELYKITKDGIECILNGDFYLNTEDGEWLYKSEGKYYDENQEECTDCAFKQIKTRWNGIYILKQTGDSMSVFKNNMRILTNVTDIWEAGDAEERIYAIRTDGTVWNITDIPEKLTSLAPYTAGDVNEDGKIDLQDLRTVLRKVCGKVELTESQNQAADVETDGKIDVRDLRKLLRYVCGKIDTL